MLLDCKMHCVASFFSQQIVRPFWSRTVMACSVVIVAAAQMDTMANESALSSAACNSSAVDTHCPFVGIHEEDVVGSKQLLGLTKH